MRLWYRDPAGKWEEALPVGNGRMGGMVYGRLGEEILQLNEDSIWSGKPVDRINPDAYRKLPEIRKLIREGRIPEAEQLALYALSGIPNCQRSYQTAGELRLFFRDPQPVDEYCRELDLDDGIVKIVYKIGESTYRREVFASCPDGVIVYRMEAEGPGRISFDARIGRGYNELDEVKAEDTDSLLFNVDGGEGISFCACVKAAAEEGSLEIIGEHLLVRDAKAVTMVIGIVTGFREKDYRGKCLEQIGKAAERGYQELRRRHTEDYRALFGRLRVKVGRDDKDTLPTDLRLEAVKRGEKDPGLAALHFQYGRYLLLSSSRPGSLPANLQGIWNESMTPPWGGKYTININLEMNYWIAESGNLSQCHMPYFEHLKRVMERGREVARRMYGCRGSVAHHNTDIYGDAAPQDHYIPASYWVMGEAWLATHIWEHYLYTGDRGFLEEYFEILHECVLFFSDFLIEGEDGTLVTSPSVSPENTYILPDGTRGCMCESPAMDNEILRELLGGYLEACRVLGRDGDGEEAELFAEARRILERLPKMKVGRYGQIQEWTEDYEEAEPGHRHISQLYALYPGTGLNWYDTPEWMSAARKTLERRLSYGGGHTGWSRAWIIGLWARLGEGAKAEENYYALLAGSTFPNLMDNHPAGDGAVFQIDGNMGASAAFLEMLAQSHGERITLLPAVAGSFDEGEIQGVRLRGGITLNMKWNNGRVCQAGLTADEDREVTLHVNGCEKKVSLKAGEEWNYEETPSGTVYRNVFSEIGKSEGEIDARLREIVHTFFYDEEEKVYHPVDGEMAYIEDTGNVDARTEGMSYGMMMCVQLDMKEEFDRIWKWAKTYMYMEDGYNEGYFAWSCAPDGTKNADGPAPDGEEYFALALFFASHRWGDGEGIFNYSHEAKEILRACLHKGENGRPGCPMWNHENHQILFVPGSPFTDPSYHLPHFYELFARWSYEEDRPFWQEAVKASRAYLKAACHPMTGMNAEYAEFDGSPVRKEFPWGRHDRFYSDAYRTVANIGLDYAWFGVDEGQADAAARLQYCLGVTNREDPFVTYEVDGTRLDQPALHPVGMLATTAQGTLAIPERLDGETLTEKGRLAKEWVERFWDTPMRKGERRYYDNCLYLFAFLALAGRYRIW